MGGRKTIAGGELCVLRMQFITQKRIKIVIAVAVGLFFTWAIIMTSFDVSGKVEHSDVVTITVILAVVGAMRIMRIMKKNIESDVSND